ncbi:MAG: Vitamin B12 transporter BtuB [Elusimicrobia bacterium]|nr:Vitamin B12 transporter BtuB [Elusimicrobiota bacterium]
MKIIGFRPALVCLLGAVSFIQAQSPLPTSVTVLTQEDFLAQHYYSVGDALRGVTSLKLEQDGSRGTKILPKLRGLSSTNNVLVMVDGVPLTHEYNTLVDLSEIPLAMVDRIEITRGGAPLIYSAEAVGGTIHIITTRPNQKGFIADLGTGVGRDGAKKHVGKIKSRTHWGDLTYTPSLAASSGFSDNEDYDATDHYANFTRSFNGKGYWGGDYFYHDSQVGVSNGTPVPFSQWNGKLERESSTHFRQRTVETQQLKLFVSYPLVAGGTTTATYTDRYRNHKDRETRDGVALRDEDSNASTFDLSWKKSIFDLGFRSQQLKRQIYPEDTKVVYQNGTYATGRWSNKIFTLAPGLRLDHHSRSGNFLSPRITFIYHPRSSFLISATRQRSHRPPSFEELFLSSAIAMNPQLKDEKSVHSDIGFQWKPKEKLQVKSTAFFVEKSNLIAPDSNLTWTNGGTEKSRGLETEIDLTLGNDPIRRHVFSFHWTHQNSERSLPSTSGFVDSALSPQDLFSAKWIKHFPRKIFLENEIQHQADQYELDNRQGLKIPASTLWNARITFKILSADLYFAINNILRERYAEAIGKNPNSGGGTTSVLSPQPERTYWTGVSILFTD